MELSRPSEVVLEKSQNETTEGWLVCWPSGLIPPEFLMWSRCAKRSEVELGDGIGGWLQNGSQPVIA
jgi:hypothetical protein